MMKMQQQGLSKYYEEYPEKGVIPRVLKNAFKRVEKCLSNLAEDIRFSGSTCSSLLLFGRKIYSANLGDSRALLVKKGNDRSKKEEDDFDFKQLSRDHNLYDEDEKTRI